MTALLREQACCWCLHASAARLALDKRGRPFVVCHFCGARTFMMSFVPSLAGFALLPPVIKALLRKTSPQLRRTKLVELLDQLQERARILDGTVHAPQDALIDAAASIGLAK